MRPRAASVGERHRDLSMYLTSCRRPRVSSVAVALNGNHNQVSFCPFALREVSVLAELTLGHLRYLYYKID